MTEQFYPWPVREERATLLNRFQMLLFMWAVVNSDKPYPLTFSQKVDALWVTFKYYFLTLHPKVAYRAG